MHIRCSAEKKDQQGTAIVFKKEKGEELLLDKSGYKRLVIGNVDSEKINHRKLILLARKIIFAAKQHHIKKLVIDFGLFNFSQLILTEEEKAELLAVNFEMANYEFVKFKSTPKEGWGFVEEIIITGKITPSVKQAFQKGQILGQGVNTSRDLANTPGGDMTPALLAESAKKLAKGTKLKVQILDQSKMKRLGMGAILAVGSGSAEKPLFIVMEYQGGKKKQQPVVLVGKAITFDTGGINIKPEQGIDDMHMDMTGGASVMSIMWIADQLRIKKNIVALIPVAENMPSGSSFRPGDIIKSLSGKTIEVKNTDAEGRLVLCDALTYAKRYNPQLVIDVATLTGAAWVALGNRASALFTKDETLQHQFEKFGELSGDYVWPMPLWEEYEEEIKGTFADLSNMGKFGRIGGAIAAAAFLYQFAKDYPWVHIDIAPRIATFEGEYLAKGSYGAGVLLVVKALETI